MSALHPIDTSQPAALFNGPGAAAILSAGIGCFSLGLIATLADKSTALKAGLTLYKPTGPLSGVTTAAILLWLLVWFVLARLWSEKNVALARISAIAFVLLALGFLLTFPPFVDLL